MTITKLEDVLGKETRSIHLKFCILSSNQKKISAAKVKKAFKTRTNFTEFCNFILFKESYKMLLIKLFVLFYVLKCISVLPKQKYILCLSESVFKLQIKFKKKPLFYIINSVDCSNHSIDFFSLFNDMLHLLLF